MVFVPINLCSRFHVPFLRAFFPPHCVNKCWKMQLQYYCSEAHLLSALDGFFLISIAVETGASHVTSLGISNRVCSCINCITCFTLYRPVLQWIYRHSFLCMFPSPVTPEKSSHYCTNSIFYSLWCTFNLKLFAMYHACRWNCYGILVFQWYFSCWVQVTTYIVDMPMASLGIPFIFI